MGKKILILHGGGPTAVLNSSLYGALKEAKKHDDVEKIYAARNGSGGLLRKELIDLTDVSQKDMERLLQTPGSAIGTSRDEVEEKDYEDMVNILLEKEIHYVLFNGGNGTMDTCGKLYKACQRKNAPISLMGIPKTMDNDIAVTDHSPGFGSAALYIAKSIKELSADVRGLAIHVVVVEASGRNAGWITAASALAEDEDGLGPDLIYLPEIAFDEKKFLEDVKKKLQQKKGLVVVVSEGLKDKAGNPIVPPIFKTGRATYFGDVSTHLANLIIQKLGYKARGEKPGLLGRASITMQSRVDREEAVLAGVEACKAVLNGVSGKMVAFRRKKIENAGEYGVETFLVDIEEVMLHEKTMPAEFINEEKNGVTKAFKDWCLPLLGEMPNQMIYFN